MTERDVRQRRQDALIGGDLVRPFQEYCGEEYCGELALHVDDRGELG
jgi:hypothetical protein